MRQQLRLRVLAPVAVLGLLGVGYGAFAYGKAPENAPLPPAATTTTAVPVGGGMALEPWAKLLDALCLRQDTEVLKLGPLDDLSNFSGHMTQLIEMGERYGQELVQLGWPRGHKAAVLALRAKAAESLKAARQLMNAFERGDRSSFDRALQRLTKLGIESERIVRRLGAEKCADNRLRAEAEAKGKAAAKDFEAPKSAETRLKFALLARPEVVVVFYTPKSLLDSVAVLEARAAAETVDAAFVPVNGAVNREVEGLAQRYDVLETPAVLIFVRGPRVASRFGLADRETVAQAVVNARR